MGVLTINIGTPTVVLLRGVISILQSRLLVAFFPTMDYTGLPLKLRVEGKTKLV